MEVSEEYKTAYSKPSELSDNFVDGITRIPLNFGSVILSLLGILLLMITLVNKRDKEFHRSRKIPRVKGLLPIRLPIIDGIYGMIRARRDGIQMLEELDKECGKLYELPFALTSVTFIADLSVVQAILSSTLPEHLNRPQFSTENLRDVFHDGLFTSEYNKWSVQRKVLNRSFTYNSLQHYLVFMNDHSRKLVKSLISSSEANNTSNGDFIVEGDRVPELLYCYAFKTIAQIIMGTDTVSEEKSAELTQKFTTFKDLLIDKLMNPLSFYLKKKKYDHIHDYLKEYIFNTIQNYKNGVETTQNGDAGSEKFDENGKEATGMKPFRCMIEELLCSDMTNAEIYDQVATFLGTGHETTVTSIKLLLFNLALNPSHQTICRDEIDAMLDEKLEGKDRSHDYSISLSMEDMQNLKYLERCIMESGRVLPSAPVFLRRIDAPLKVNTILEFPGGTNFAINAWKIHRDKELYSDPEKFDPDRFLPEYVVKRNAYSYIPFSMGVKNCIGFKLAMLYIKFIMVWILRNFDIFTTDKVEDVKLLFGITLMPERNYNIVLRKRKINLTKIICHF